jgi:hypothetical protein
MTKKGATMSPETRQRISEALRAGYAKRRQAAKEREDGAARTAARTAASPMRASRPPGVSASLDGLVGEKIVAKCFADLWRGGLLSEEVVAGLVALAVSVGRAKRAIERQGVKLND